MAHLDTIKTLKTSRDFDSARTERRAQVKAHTADSDALKLAINGAIKELRHRDNRPEGIWQGTYRAVESAFENARKKAIEQGITPRLRGEWKGTAESFLTNQRWNGEGKISANHSSVAGKLSHEVQKWSSILAGKNPFLKVRKFESSDLAAHGLSDKFKIKDTLYLVSIRRCGITDVDEHPFVSAPVVLHRLPQPDDRIAISTFITKKVGLRHKTELNLAVRVAAKESDGVETAFVQPCWEKQSDGSIIAAYWQHGEESGSLTIPASIGRGLEYAKSLDATVTSYVHAFNTVRKALGLSEEKRGSMRWIGRPDNPIITPKAGVDTNAALSLVAAEFRHHEKEHGHFGGGGEKAGDDLVDDFYLRLKDLFTFPDRMQGLNFTTGWLFRQKYQHLYPWAVNERSGCLLHRREIYRMFAKELLSDAKELHTPDTDYRNRNMSDEQKLAAPSELLAILKNFAIREGVETIEEEEAEVSANIKHMPKTEGFAESVSASKPLALAAHA
jgi:hypothetical protein